MILRRILAALFVLCAAVLPAQAQKTKSALTSEIGTNWPDNTSGAITPAILRSTVIDIVNSYYDLAGGTSLSCAAHQWVAALPTLSSITCTQPSVADLANINANSVLGNNTGSPAGVIQLTAAQITAMINVATASLPGALPAWPNNTTTYFRGDGTYQTLNFAALGGSATCAQLPALTGNVTSTAGSCGTTIGAGVVTYANLASAALATASQYMAGTANTVVPASVIYTAETTTTFGSTTTFDFSTFINTAVTLTGNITTMSVANVKAGQAGSITFIQDGSGNRTSVWNSIFKFAGGTTPTLSTAAGAIDVLFYSCRSATVCPASLVQNMK